MDAEFFFDVYLPPSLQNIFLPKSYALRAFAESRSRSPGIHNRPGNFRGKDMDNDDLESLLNSSFGTTTNPKPLKIPEFRLDEADFDSKESPLAQIQKKAEEDRITPTTPMACWPASPLPIDDDEHQTQTMFDTSRSESPQLEQDQVSAASSGPEEKLSSPPLTVQNILFSSPPPLALSLKSPPRIHRPTLRTVSITSRKEVKSRKKTETSRKKNMACNNCRVRKIRCSVGQRPCLPCRKKEGYKHTCIDSPPTVPRAEKKVPRKPPQKRKRLADALNVHQGQQCERDPMCSRPKSHPGHCKVGKRQTFREIQAKKRKRARKLELFPLFERWGVDSVGFQ
ncbi:hypothetical protein AAMO2058_000608800 [Amorphochlora amoebiformis]|eukprot:1394050-Amorphochlora_amoeboformis.AAC.2